jgi:hypothetical protein
MVPIDTLGTKFSNFKVLLLKAILPDLGIRLNVNNDFALELKCISER